jgi:hypothetical protein
MVMTVVVMSGAVVAPTNAAAQAGDLIKMDGLSAVYYLGDDGQRYVFPNESTYFSWYSDFSGVVTVPSSELQSYPIGGNVTMRPGTKLVKITTDPTVYAVEPGGELRSIVSEENAKDLYGDNWAQRVVDVPDAFFVNYDKKSALPVGEYPTGTLLQEEGGSDVYYVDNGDYRMFSGEASFLANNLKWSDVITTDMNLTATGSEISGFDADIFNPAGGATSGGGDVPTGTGLSAALSASTPAATTIPYNVQGVVYTSVNLTASNDGAVELTGLEVKRTGLGEPGDFDKVYVEVDGVRHGNKRTLGSDNVANLYFNTDSSKITIPAGETITLDIVADMDTNSTKSGDNALSIVSASAIDASGTVSGSFPITGNLMSLSSVGAPTVTVDFGSTGTDDVYLGDTQVEVAEFDVDNTTTSEDISFTEITLENTGSADSSEVMNYTLYNDSDEVVAGPVNADSDDMIRFMLNEEVELEDGRSETFTVKADIYDGRGEKVLLGLDETTDLEAVGLNNGFNAVVTDSGDGVTYTVNGGDLNFTEANNNPGDVDVAPEDEDVLFLASEVESLEEMMTITEITFDLSTGSSHASSLEALTLYLDGDVVAGPSDFDTATSSTITFDEEFQVSGTQVLELKADISDSASAGDYVLDLDSANVTAENEEGDAVDGADIMGTVDGGTISIATGDVTLTKDATYGSRNVVSGSDDLLVGQFVLEVNDAEGVKIDKYSVDVTVADALELTNIEELYISEDTDIITDVSATGNDFNVNQELAAGATKVVKIYASVDDNFTTADDNDTLITTLTVTGEGLVSTEPVDSGAKTGQTMTFVSGLLSAAVSAGTPDSAIVIAGTSDVEVAEWEFEAENTSYMLKDIKVGVYSDAPASTTEEALVTSMTLNGETATVINGVATFDGPFEVEKDDDLKLTLYANFNGDFNSIDSGDTANFALKEYKHKAGNENTYTTESLTVTSYDTAELMYARNTVPTFVATAGPTTTLKTTNNDIMEISVTADESDDVSIVANQLVVISNASSTGTVTILDSNDNEVATSTITAVTTSQDVSLDWTIQDANGEVVPAGETKVYTVRVSFDSAPAADSTLSVELDEVLTWWDEENVDGSDDRLDITGQADLINDLSGSFEIDNK